MKRVYTLQRCIVNYSPEAVFCLTFEQNTKTPFDGLGAIEQADKEKESPVLGLLVL